MPRNNWAFYYDQSGNQTFCLLDSMGNMVDVGESDIHPQLCGYSSSPVVADYTGPEPGVLGLRPSSCA